MVLRTSTYLSRVEDNAHRPASFSKEPPIEKAPATVPDFSLITTVSLKKYRKEFKLRVSTGTNKSELASLVSKHFAELPAPEDENAVIDGFLNAVRNQCKENQPDGLEEIEEKSVNI